MFVLASPCMCIYIYWCVCVCIYIYSTERNICSFTKENFSIFFIIKSETIQNGIHVQLFPIFD